MQNLKCPTKRLLRLAYCLKYVSFWGLLIPYKQFVKWSLPGALGQLFSVVNILQTSFLLFIGHLCTFLEYIVDYSQTCEILSLKLRTWFMIHLLSLLTLLLVWYAFAMMHYSKDSLRNNFVISQLGFILYHCAMPFCASGHHCLYILLPWPSPWYNRNGWLA